MRSILQDLGDNQPGWRTSSITFGDVELKTKSWLVKRSDVLINRLEEGYDGLLGNRTFEGYWCELSFSKGKIILHKEKPACFTKHSPVKIPNKFDADFYIPVYIDDKDYYFNIDTGMYDGIYFPDAVINKKNKSEYIDVIT
ncbi:MAG: hypothetical protein LBC51_09570 [Treponema sp.]|jgi:hypothetical protein|nr:hypothetical protein [Treponema sp.]